MMLELKGGMHGTMHKVILVLRFDPFSVHILGALVSQHQSLNVFPGHTYSLVISLERLSLIGIFLLSLFSY